MPCRLSGCLELGLYDRLCVWTMHGQLDLAMVDDWLGSVVTSLPMAPDSEGLSGLYVCGLALGRPQSSFAHSAEAKLWKLLMLMSMFHSCTGAARKAALERLSRPQQVIYAILELQPQSDFTSKRISQKLAQLGLKTIEDNKDNLLNTLLTGTPAADQSKPYVAVLDKTGRASPRNWNEKSRKMLTSEWFDSWYWDLTQYVVKDDVA